MTNRSVLAILCAICLGCSLASSGLCATVFVKTTGDDANSGASWSAALKSVQVAVDRATAGSEIWVASGTYANCAITLKDGVALYGGFAGTETSRTQRNWATRVTVLQGAAVDMNGAVISAPSGITSSTRVDGFTVCNGSGHVTQSTDPQGYPVFTSQGGGFYCVSSSPVIANNVITGNTVWDEGGGIYCIGGSPLIVDNVITSNLAGKGGAIYCGEFSTASIFNNTIVGNLSDAVYVYNSSPVIKNNIIAYNANGLSRYSTAGSPVLANNCIYNPDGDNYGGIPSGSNDIGVDPKLVAWQYRQFHIQPDSPCRNTGDNSVVGADWNDMDRQARIQGVIVDIGADESNGVTWTFTPTVIRVSPSGSDANDGSSWALAKRTVQSAVDLATTAGGDVWVAAGTYVENVNLKPFVRLYGGFAGSELARDSRNWVASKSVIDGGGVSACISALYCSNTGCGIDGFTVQRGAVSLMTNWGGGIFCIRSSLTISNNTIVGNSTAGIECRYFGGRVTVANNAISGSSYGISTELPGTITNNVITGNGTGIFSSFHYDSSLSITGNTIVGNQHGISALNGVAQIYNNIVAFNGSGVTLGSACALRNNCVYNPDGVNYWFGSPGIGDISVDPKLDALGYGQAHIQPNSPCRDAGYDAAVLPGSLDMDGQPRLQGTHVDIGADESDGTTWSFVPDVVRVSPSGDDTDGSSWAHAKRTVQGGIDAAASRGGEVWVAAATYHEKVAVKNFVYLYGGFLGNEASRSSRDVVANKSILDGSGLGAWAVTPSPGWLVDGVDGFTVRNGGAGGIGASAYSSTRGTAVIANCTIVSNGGPGVGCNAATVKSCSITDNRGAGVYCSSATVSGNTIARNASSYDGGGVRISTSGAVVTNNIVMNNSTTGYGGGIYVSDGARDISGNLVVGNTSGSWGGGIATGVFSGTMTNNTIVGNTASFDAGGVFISDSASAISNNLVAFNSSGIRVATSGTPKPILRNNCVYGNGTSNYNPAGAAGASDISVDPLLVGTGDYHLSLTSPCIGTGWSGAPGLPAVDMDGQLRVLGGAVEIGADEFAVSTPRQARLAPEGLAFDVGGAIVSAAFGGCFYIESDDRTAGIRVEKSGHGLTVGARAAVSGTLATSANGERCVAATVASQVGTGVVAPLGLANAGLRQSVGPDSSGLLLRTWGVVTKIDSSTFTVDDGSGNPIECLLPSGVAFDDSWTWVAVTGASSCKRVGSELHRLLLVRSADDVTPF